MYNIMNGIGFQYKESICIILIKYLMYFTKNIINTTICV